MKVNNVIRFMLDARSVSPRRVSAALGKSSEWCRVVAAPTRSPALATVTDVADALGYDVAIIDRDSGEIVARMEATARPADQTEHR